MLNSLKTWRCLGSSYLECRSLRYLVKIQKDNILVVGPNYSRTKKTLYPYVYVCDQLLQSCPTLYNPMDCSQPVSFTHGILQARTLELVAMSSFKGSSSPRDQTHISCVSCTAGRFSTTEPLRKLHIHLNET